MIPVIPLITVHDVVKVRDAPNKQYDFTKNGIRVLLPSSCTVTEELNGQYMCELEYPIDENGDWLTLNENNILSIPIIYHDQETRQLFRINNREVSMDSDGKYMIKVKAYHIFYDLYARAIEKAFVTDNTCYSAIASLFSQVFTRGGVLGSFWYPYTYYSDITDVKSVEYENVTLSAALIGEDDSICSLYGGEIYRDNFYFSINYKKEHSIKHPFPIRYGVNMVSITETIDWTNYCNYVHSTDNFGNWHDVSYAFDDRSLGEIVKIVQFNYPEENRDKLWEDLAAYFQEYSAPAVNYTIEFANLRNHELYADFIGLKNYEVGDEVEIINERLNIRTTNKIIRKVYDVLRRKTIEIELGTQKGSIVREKFMGNTVYKSTNDVIALQRTSVSSKDTRRIVNLSEQEYEDLQEKDTETLYIVVDDQEET